MRHPPGNGWSDDEAVVGGAATSFVAKAAELTLDSSFQFFNKGGRWLNIFRIGRRRCFMKKVNRRDQTLGDAPLAAAVAGHFLFKKCV